ncbi:MAG: RnfABCDGE type electron transport complex subunit D [Granulosicoccus sp.]
MNGVALDTSTIAHKRRSVSSIMLHVLVALLPGIALYALLVDSRILINLLLAIFCALVFESVLVMLRKRAVLPALKDASIVLAAVLLVLSVPQSLPTWQLVFGIFILCTLGKHVFGGLGHNPFNPAMVAYAVLIVSFPLTMTQWSTHHGLLDSAIVSANVEAPYLTEEGQGVLWDSLTGATPLDRIDAIQRDAGNADASSDRDSMYAISTTQLVLTSDWVWLSVAWLFGGVYLLFKRIISWQIPVTVLSSLWWLYLIYENMATVPVLPATAALFSGAIMLGAFFIATDPVSAATSETGKLVYGAGIGILCFFIREFSAYPEGMAFAVLLMNMCVPLIDHAITRNRLSPGSTSSNKPDKPHP